MHFVRILWPWNERVQSYCISNNIFPIHQQAYLLQSNFKVSFWHCSINIIPLSFYCCITIIFEKKNMPFAMCWIASCNHSTFHMSVLWEISHIFQQWPLYLPSLLYPQDLRPNPLYSITLEPGMMRYGSFLFYITRNGRLRCDAPVLRNI